MTPAKPVSDGASDINSRLAFFKNLQAVTNKIHATGNIDEIMLELSQDICELFNADRLTIYSVQRRQVGHRLQGQDRPAFVQGSASADFRPEHRRLRRAGAASVVNIHDVYDEAGTGGHQPEPALPAGSRSAYRLPDQADAGRADHRRAQRRALWCRADHQQQGGHTVYRRSPRRASRACARRWRSPSRTRQRSPMSSSRSTTAWSSMP